jgi:hypothetical protein
MIYQHFLQCSTACTVAIQCTSNCRSLRRQPLRSAQPPSSPDGSFCLHPQGAPPHGTSTHRINAQSTGPGLSERSSSEEGSHVPTSRAALRLVSDENQLRLPVVREPGAALKGCGRSSTDGRTGTRGEKEGPRGIYNSCDQAWPLPR